MLRIQPHPQNKAEIMVQYSSAVVHMIDPSFQVRRIAERNLRANSDWDTAYLYAISTTFCFSATAGLCTILLISAVMALSSGLPQLPGINFLWGLCYAVATIAWCEIIWRGRKTFLALFQKLRAAIFAIRAIGIGTEGITIYRRSFLSWLDRHLPWETVTNIRIVHDLVVGENTEKEALVEITTCRGKGERLRLKAVRSIEERKLLVDAFKIFARRAVDVNDIARMVSASDVQDIAFTQLWSEALRSSLPPTSSSVLQPETLLQDGRFFVEKQIGGGGQGAIYLAEMLDTSDQRIKVALKEYVLPDQEHLFDRKRAIEQFEREVHLLARLKHKNLANLLDAFIEDHRAYLVLEYLDGANLRDTVKLSGRVSLESCCAISLQVCDVLNYLHSLNPPVVHLDVSPENVIILSDGAIKLIDFNTSSDGSGLRTKLIAGKQRYMPPEQYRNEVSPQCDIYSFGCTMFFMLTGIEPEALTVLHPIITVPSIPLSLDDIVSGATSLNVETRTLTIEAMRNKLLTLSDPANCIRSLEQHAA